MNTKDKLMEYLLNVAAVFFKERGEVQLTAFLLTGEDQIAIVPIPPEIQESTPLFRGVIGKLIKDQKATAFAIMSEAWVKRFDEEDEVGKSVMSGDLRISDLDTKDEALLIAYEDNEGTTDVKAWNIHRCDGTVSVGDPCTQFDDDQVTGYSGRMLGFFDGGEDNGKKESGTLH